MTLLLTYLGNLMPLMIVGGASHQNMFHDLKSISLVIGSSHLASCLFFKASRFSACSLMEVVSQLRLYWWC